MKEGINKIITSKSKTFLTFCFLFIIGSSGFSLLDLPMCVPWVIYYLFCILIAAYIFVPKNKLTRSIFLSVFFVLLGVGRYTFSMPDCEDSNQICSQAGKKIILVGFVAGEPDRKLSSTDYLISALQIEAGDKTQKTSGKILVRAPRYPEYQYGEALKISCKLASPKEMDTGEFRYDKYLARQGVFAVCFEPKIAQTDKFFGNKALAGIFNFKKQVQKKINLLWTEPSASLISGILYGGRNGFNEKLVANFSATGVSHITAVSGYNITIIIVIMMSLLISLGLYRQQAFYFVLFSTLIFVVFSGLSASAVRAAIMGILVLVAKQFGRGSSNLNIIIFTAALMQAFNPYLVFWDVGFQLSFLATIGLIYLSPSIKKSLVFLPNFLGEPLATTISAIIVTLPLILFQFGTFSLVAPLVNILVLWVIPYLMLFGFIALVISYIYSPVALVVGALPQLGASYVIMIVEYFGGKPWSHFNIKIPIAAMLILYAVLIFLMVRIYEKNKGT